VPAEVWELSGNNRRQTYQASEETEGIAAFREKRAPDWSAGPN